MEKIFNHIFVHGTWGMRGTYSRETKESVTWYGTVATRRENKKWFFATSGTFDALLNKPRMTSFHAASHTNENVLDGARSLFVCWLLLLLLRASLLSSISILKCEKNAKRFIGFFSNVNVCIMRKHLNTFNVAARAGSLRRWRRRWQWQRVWRCMKWEMRILFYCLGFWQRAFAESRIYYFSLFPLVFGRNSKISKKDNSFVWPDIHLERSTVWIGCYCNYSLERERESPPRKRNHKIINSF